MGKGPRIDCSKDVKITQQNEKDDADINVIVERAKRGAVPPIGRDVAPMYGDFTVIPQDLREVLVQVKFAENLFMSLDAFVRRRFNNDPVEMLDFLNDPKNRNEAIKLGLVKAPEVEITKAPEPPIEAVPEAGADPAATDK